MLAVWTPPPPGTMSWQRSIFIRLNGALETEFGDNRFVVKAICRVMPKSQAFPSHPAGLTERASMACGDPQPPEPSVTYLASFLQHNGVPLI